MKERIREENSFDNLGEYAVQELGAKGLAWVKLDNKIH